MPGTGVALAPALLAALLCAAALASPSAFPETALSASGGWNDGVAFGVGVEVVLPVPFVDVSAGAEVAVGRADGVEARLSATGLVFPTVGTVPPVAFGAAADLTWRDDAARVHVGVVTGLDLLYVSDLPAVISAYLAPGYAVGEGVSLAWSVEARYYLDEAAVVLGGSDLVPLSLGVRVPF